MEEALFRLENLEFSYYHIMNPGSTCLGSFWVQSVLVSVLLGRGKPCGAI